MLNKIIEFSVKQKLIIGLFVIFLIGYGAYEVTKLPIDAVPDITNNQVQIITVAPSLGATDIERLVTFPVEQANSNIHGLKELRSFSKVHHCVNIKITKSNSRRENHHLGLKSVPKGSPTVLATYPSFS